LSDADNSGPGGNITTNNDIGYGFLVAGGRKFDFGLRLEAEGAYRQNSVSSVTVPGAGTTAGSGNFAAASFMANALYEFDNIGYDLGKTVKPYFGGGVGFANIWANDVQTQGVTISDDSDIQFAYQAIAGVGFAVAPKTTLFVEYRYFATLDPHFKTGAGTDFKSEYQTNNAMLGLRYAF
jgi:opacity protein-like surface antigen